MMSDCSQEELRNAALRRRDVLMFVALVATLGLARSWSWAALTAVPLLCGWFSVHLFRPEVLDRWIAGGRLMATDGLIVALALVAAVPSRPVAVVALAVIVTVGALAADRFRTWIAGAALAVAVFVVWEATAGTGFKIGLIDLPSFVVLAAALAHFGPLGERIAGSQLDAERARRESKELWALLDITDSITSMLDVNQVMHAIVERIGDLVDTPSCSILLAENLSSDCFVIASKGHPEADMLELNLSNYPEVQRVLTTRQVLVVDEIATHPLVEPARAMLLERGFRSMLVLPLMYGKQVLGALVLKARRERAFSPRSLRFCKVAAGVSANALKNAVLYREVSREAALHRATGEKLQRVLDGTPDMIVATDSEGRITLFNKGAEALIGLRADEARNHTLAEILGQELSADRPCEIQLAGGGDGPVEVSLVGARLSNHDQPGGCVWIGRDVTKLRRVERSLVQAERLSSLGEVVAGVAHELNNPLSGVVGYAELLRANAGDPEQIADLDRIVESSMRCQKIVCKLLSFARQQPPEKRHQSLNDTVARVLDLKSYHLRTSQIETVVELDPSLPDTNFDAHQIEQVVLNLLNNAEQAISSIKRSGRIVLSTRTEGDEIVLEVVDDGPGIDPGARERVFDPFFTTKEFGKGTGLGLSVSYGIVQEHGGRIELADPRPDGGAGFQVYLPVVARDLSKPALPVEIDVPIQALEGRRILVAEDEPVVRELFARILSGDGAQVAQAQDGDEAWDLIEKDDFDLIVVDLRMPNMNGRQLYERVAEQRPDLLRRFVFATGDLMRPDTMEFLEGLPNRILIKPLQQETIRRVLSQALGTTSSVSL